eukprot:SAG31_NODE_35434_length_323_cov_0.696429_1_plen_39_part_10
MGAKPASEHLYFKSVFTDYSLALVPYLGTDAGRYLKRIV